MTVARGRLQKDLWQAILNGYCVYKPSYGLKGKAKGYSKSYNDSWQSMLMRARRAGYNLAITRGPRGGVFSEHTFLMDKAPDDLCPRCRRGYIERFVGGL